MLCVLLQRKIGRVNDHSTLQSFFPQRVHQGMAGQGKNVSYVQTGNYHKNPIIQKTHRDLKISSKRNKKR
mgnify:CR=1 FL=1